MSDSIEEQEAIVEDVWDRHIKDVIFDVKKEED